MIIEAVKKVVEILTPRPYHENVIYVSFKRMGFSGVVERNCLTMVDMKIFAMVGKKAAPIAVPSTCRKVEPANSK